MKPRIDKIEAEYFRKGKCAKCGGSTERIRTFTGTTMAEVEAAAQAWLNTPLVHKRCET